MLLKFLIHSVLLCFIGWSADLTVQEDPFKISIEKWHHVAVMYKQCENLKKTETLKKIKTSQYQEELEVALNLTDAKKPLVVLIPGLFGELDSIDVHFMGQLLYKKGFNLLRFPNPVSKPVVRLNPSYGPLDFESESAAYVDVLKKIQDEYHFPQIHFLGISYGAFIAAVASAKAGELFNGQLVMISPPKNILSSLKMIDEYYDEEKPQFGKFPFEQLGFFIYYQWNLFWGKEIEISPRVAKTTLIVHLFHRTFTDLVRTKELLMHPRPFWKFYEDFKPKVTEQRNKMRFIPFLKKNNPGFFDHPDHQDVLYWAKQSGHRWKIFTSHDDFINRDSIWPEDSNILFYEKAGHIFGFMDRPDFLKQIENYF